MIHRTWETTATPSTLQTIYMDNLLLYGIVIAFIGFKLICSLRLILELDGGHIQGKSEKKDSFVKKNFIRVLKSLNSFG